LWGGVIDGGRLLRRTETMPTFIAEGAVWLIKKATRGTSELKLFTTLFAELGPFTILELTFGTLHFLPTPQNRKDAARLRPAFDISTYDMISVNV